MQSVCVGAEAPCSSVSVETAGISPPTPSNSMHPSPVSLFLHSGGREPQASPVLIVRYITTVSFGEGTPVHTNHCAGTRLRSLCQSSPLFRQEGGTGAGQTNPPPPSAGLAAQQTCAVRGEGKHDQRQK